MFVVIIPRSPEGRRADLDIIRFEIPWVASGRFSKRAVLAKDEEFLRALGALGHIKRYELTGAVGRFGACARRDVHHSI